MTTRKLASWIDAFYEYTSTLPSPPLFRKWAAIGAIAGALERKVWIRTFNMNLYPNLYTVLVAPPGVGKTVLTKNIQDLWSEISVPDGKHHMAPSSVSRASIIDALREADRNVVRPQEKPSIITFNSLMICVNELGTLIPAYDNDFMNTLTDIYDGHRYGERKRSKELNFTMLHPQINLIACTSPSYLNDLLPPGAWDQGFISRVIMIYNGEATLRNPFTEEEKKANTDLIHDLKIIADLYGKMKFNDDAAKAFVAWHFSNGPPTPDHPKLLHYNTRRSAHVLKLCMIASASRSDNLTITVEDYQLALDWLVEAESFMPDIFKSMTAGGDSRSIEDTYYYVHQLYIRENRKSITEARIIGYLQQRVPAHSVMRVLDIMMRSGLLIKELDGYKPMPRPPK